MDHCIQILLLSPEEDRKWASCLVLNKFSDFFFQLLAKHHQSFPSDAAYQVGNTHNVNVDPLTSCCWRDTDEQYGLSEAQKYMQIECFCFEPFFILPVINCTWKATARCLGKMSILISWLSATARNNTKYTTEG